MWLLLAVLLAWPAAAQTADLQSQGLKALDAHQYDQAIALFSQASAADPTDYGAHFNLGLAYGMAGKDAESAAEYRKVLAMHPGLYEAELNLGIVLLRDKDNAGAIAQLQAAAAQKPKTYQPQFYLGQALEAANRLPDAEAAYRAALAADPAPPPDQQALLDLGLARVIARQTRREEAEPYYRKAASFNPAYRSALLDLAALYEENKQTDQAIAIYREFPDNAQAQEREGALLLQSGHAAEAIPPLETAVAKAPNSANRLALAQAYVQEKQLAKAEPLTAEAVAAAPRDKDLRLFFGRILRDERKFPEAAAQFTAVTQLDPGSVPAWNELAGVDLVSNRYAEALAAFDRVRALGGETTANFFFRAMAHDHLHQSKDALEDYGKFLAGSHGEHPDQEFQARQRVRTLEKELGKR